MADDASRKRLGRGLAALIGEMDQPAEQASRPQPADRKLPIEFVVRNPNNPRRDFAEEELADLAASIREHGIIQPIVVRPKRDASGMFELIAGERRWRAAQRAGLTELPVIIRDVDDKVALELAIIENVQRADLNPIEEAAGYQKLMDEYDYTQADLGDVIGTSKLSGRKAGSAAFLHLADEKRMFNLNELITDTPGDVLGIHPWEINNSQFIAITHEFAGGFNSAVLLRPITP